MENKITVLITTYNCADYIKSAVESILNQTYKNFELLIIDDGSDDNTENIIRGFTDSRIRYLKTEHIGRSRALNLGLKKAQNDLVALMDSDDIALPDRLERTLSYKIPEYNDVVFSDAVYFQKKKTVYLNSVRKGESLREKILLHGHICNSSVLYNKNFILENGGYDESLSMFEDFELWLKLKNKCNFIRIPEILMIARIREKSSSRHDESKARELTKEFHKKYLADENNKGLVRKSRLLFSEKRDPFINYLFQNKIKPKLEYFFFKISHYSKYCEFNSYIK